MVEHGQSQQVSRTCLQVNQSRGPSCLLWVLLLLLLLQAGQPRSFGDLENELLKGQKLQGVLTSDEVQVRPLLGGGILWIVTRRHVRSQQEWHCLPG
jgi:hypothetical protein